MADLVERLRLLCCLRLGPQDLPHAPRLLALVLVLDVLVDAAVGLARGHAGLSLTASLLALLVVLGGVAALLALHQHQARFVQTALALAASALVFSVLAIPAQLLVMPIPSDPAQVSGAQMLALLALAGLGLWALAVSAHILRHALERSFASALVLALALNLGATLAVSMLFPASTA